MARGINKVILVGNLGRDPESRYTQNGQPVTSFSVATSESWRDKQTGQNQEKNGVAQRGLLRPVGRNHCPVLTQRIQGLHRGFTAYQ